MNDQTILSADEQAEIDRAAKIAEQNDRFRKTWGADFTVPGQIVVTRSVASLSAGAQVQIMRAVRAVLRHLHRGQRPLWGSHLWRF